MVSENLINHLTPLEKLQNFVANYYLHPDDLAKNEFILLNNHVKDKIITINNIKHLFLGGWRERSIAGLLIGIFKLEFLIDDLVVNFKDNPNYYVAVSYAFGLTRIASLNAVKALEDLVNFINFEVNDKAIKAVNNYFKAGIVICKNLSSNELLQELNYLNHRLNVWHKYSGRNFD